MLCSLCVYLQYKRLNNTLPIFDPGIILIITTTLYCAYPIFSFAMSGFAWTEISDRRMWNYNLSSHAFSKFMMLPTYYTLALTLSYAFFSHIKDKPIIKSPTLYPPVQKSQFYHVLVLYISIKLYFFILTNFLTTSKPYWLLQINNILSAMSFVFFLFLLVYVIQNWKRKFFKIFIFVIILSQVYLTFVEGHGRTSLFLHILAFVLCYHFFIRKISFRFASVSFTFLFFVFILRGFLKIGLIQSFGQFSPFSATNEFTTLIGTAYDIYSRMNLGLIEDIPLQAYFNDLLLLVPSQLLPFQKLDLSQWYLVQINLHGRGVGSMFGVISQGVIGGGIPELIIRGLLLGYFFARLFRWFYGKSHVSIWEVVFMIFVALKAYNTYRAGTGYLFYFIIYHFLGAYLLYFVSSKVIAKLKLYK